MGCASALVSSCVPHVCGGEGRGGERAVGCACTRACVRLSDPEGLLSKDSLARGKEGRGDAALL